MVEKFFETLKNVDVLKETPNIKGVPLDSKDINLNYDPIFKEKMEYKKIDDITVSKKEQEIYDNANLEKSEVNERECLKRTDIDYEEVDSNGLTNKERMERGMAPLKDGKPIELHHIGQEMDSPLAELTMEEHRGKGNDSILHDKKVDSQIDRREFKKEKEEYWKVRAAEL
ncbi:MAG: HNH/ENDO VII family nuclease [Cetobacterium sp.]